MVVIAAVVCVRRLLLFLSMLGGGWGRERVWERQREPLSMINVSVLLCGFVFSACLCVCMRAYICVYISVCPLRSRFPPVAAVSPSARLTSVREEDVPART